MNYFILNRNTQGDSKVLTRIDTIIDYVITFPILEDLRLYF